MMTPLRALVALLLGAACSTVGPDSEAAPTYGDDVAKLLAAHCVGCHHEGGPAPFALAS